MQDEGISPGEPDNGAAGLDREDAKWQSAVLACVLAEPRQWARAELERELLGESPEFAERDAYQRALEELVRVGLLRRQGSLVLATRAARHFHDLELE